MQGGNEKGGAAEQKCPREREGIKCHHHRQRTFSLSSEVSGSLSSTIAQFRDARAPLNSFLIRTVLIVVVERVEGGILLVRGVI